MEEKQILICDKCQIGMEDREARFVYLGKTFHHKVKRCPQCGQVCLSEDLVNGRMKEVEAIVEEK